MKISRKALPILSVLTKLNTHFGKLYCFPSQEKLLELLQKFCSLNISRRQLNYDLKAICDHGLIRRTRRHRRSKIKGMEFHSTLYEISFLGYNLLVRSGVISWGMLKGIQNRIKAGLAKRKNPCAKNDLKPGLANLADVFTSITPEINTS